MATKLFFYGCLISRFWLIEAWRRLKLLFSKQGACGAADSPYWGGKVLGSRAKRESTFISKVSKVWQDGMEPRALDSDNLDKYWR
jgi:hypothetical protein